jgi:hypothetical protein
MASTKTLTITSSAPVILTPPAVHSGVDITVQNQGSTDVYIGTSTVSSSNYGVILGQGEALGLVVPARDEIYAITASSTSTVSVLTVGLP